MWVDIKPATSLFLTSVRASIDRLINRLNVHPRLADYPDLFCIIMRWRNMDPDRKITHEIMD